MAMSTSAIWEVRPTVGNDTNGGAFVAGASGVDFSQQNAKNTSGSNISVTDVVATGVATITSATANFTTDIVGNVVFLSGSGITTGWYQVVTFTNSTTVILDSSPGTGTGATMNIGGALATIAQAVTNFQTYQTIYVKDTGAYAVTATLDTPGTQLTIIGYGTTRGDSGRVTWTTATNSTILVVFQTPGANLTFKNIDFTNTASTSAECIDGSVVGQTGNVRFSNCSFSGFTTALALGYISGVHFNALFLFMDSCEVTACSGDGISCNGPVLMIDCYIHGNGGNGITGTTVGSGNVSSGPVRLERCVIYNNGGVGITNVGGNVTSETTWMELLNCAVVANTSDGILMQGGSGWPNQQNLVVINTIIESNGGFGINSQSNVQAIFILLNNAFRANASGNYNGGSIGSGTTGLGPQPSDITLTAEPFNNPSGNDFTLNNTAGGGALCRAAGFPSSLP